MRRSVITGGTDEGIRRIENDADRLEAEAVRLLQVEQHVKEAAQSTEEWLHEAYCLMPDIYTWGLTIAWANERLKSDELAKYTQMLDEFQADIGTTLTIPCTSLRGGENLAETYALRPLVESATIDEAIGKIRAIYRGRSIIPRVWYEKASSILDRLRSAGWSPEIWNHALGTMGMSGVTRAAGFLALNDVDYAQAFGRTMTVFPKDFHGLALLGGLFNYYGDDDHSSSGPDMRRDPSGG
jgi:hypothetical protein